MGDESYVEISSDEGGYEPSLVFFGGGEVPNIQAHQTTPIDLCGSTAASPVGNWASFSILTTALL